MIFPLYEEGFVRKPTQTYDLPIPDDDYKAAFVQERDKANFESPNNWIYLGADIRNACYAKVGLTMGDLSSRSYSSANPNYHIFCAFQCYLSTSVEQLKGIEEGALAYLDIMFPHCRAYHYESQVLSECYYDVSFKDFFISLHNYLHDYHLNNFMTDQHLNEMDENDGYTLSMLFNPRFPHSFNKEYIELVKQ